MSDTPKIINEVFEKEWQEYLDCIEDLEITLCPMCKKVGEVMFNSGRVLEIAKRLDGKHGIV